MVGFANVCRLYRYVYGVQIDNTVHNFQNICNWFVTLSPPLLDKYLDGYLRYNNIIRGGNTVEGEKIKTVYMLLHNMQCGSYLGDLFVGTLNQLRVSQNKNQINSVQNKQVMWTIKTKKENDYVCGLIDGSICTFTYENATPDLAAQYRSVLVKQSISARDTLSVQHLSLTLLSKFNTDNSIKFIKLSNSKWKFSIDDLKKIKVTEGVLGSKFFADKIIDVHHNTDIYNNFFALETKVLTIEDYLDVILPFSYVYYYYVIEIIKKTPVQEQSKQARAGTKRDRNAQGVSDDDDEDVCIVCSEQLDEWDKCAPCIKSHGYCPRCISLHEKPNVCIICRRTQN